jgi:two-component system, sensor histidine kinase and response regulator
MTAVNNEQANNSWLTKEHLQAIVDASFDAMFSISENGKILMVNEAAVSLFGYSREELINQDIGIIAGQEHAKNHLKYMMNYRETETSKIMGKKREVPARKKDGTEFMVELGIKEIKNGSERFFAGFIKDLTEQKNHLAEMKQREVLAQASIDASFDPMLEITQKGIITMVNKATVSLFGWSKEELIGKNIR